MLNGIAPIFLFNFYKTTPTIEAKLNKIPIVSALVKRFGLPPIPLYLDEKLTGIYVESENKNIDIETELEGDTKEKTVNEIQKPLNSSVTIEMLASSESIGLTIISAMMDVILTKISSKEYDVTYLHGATTVFNGKLKSFSINQSAENTLYRISLVLTNATQKTLVAKTTPLVLGAGGLTL